MSDQTAAANAAAAGAARKPAKADVRIVRLPITIETIEDGERVAYPPGTPVRLPAAEADALVKRFGEVPAAPPVDDPAA